MKAHFAVGSMFEFKSSKGYNYLQYAHETENHIPVIGVLESERQIPLNNISEIGEILYRYFVLYHVDSAVKQGLIRYLGTAAVPERYREFPLLRLPGHVEMDGRIKNWFIYNEPLTINYKKLKDPSVRYRVDSLSEDEKKLSIASIINHPILLERINSGWRPQDLSERYGATPNLDR